MNEELSEDEQAYKLRLVDVCKEIIEEYELNKMSEDDNVWGDDEWGFDIVELERGEEEPEYDGAGFSEEDRIVNGQYRVIDNKDNNNTQDNDDEEGSGGKTDYVPWDLQTK
jgi:hypothetical protein